MYCPWMNSLESTALEELVHSGALDLGALYSFEPGNL